MINNAHQGFTFLELLIALFIFSAGLLGLMQLHAVAQRELHAAVYASRAAQQAYNLSALLTLFSAPPHSALASSLQQQWNQENAQLLPQGEGLLSTTPAGHVITVFWASPLQIAQPFCEKEVRMCVQLKQQVF